MGKTKMTTQNTLYWHDYETWGEVPAQDRPSQFAGIRTDEDLNIIGEPLMIYCRPSADCLPKPEACLITGLTPQEALEKGVPEYQFIAQIHAQLAASGTCGVGYNSIRFDDEVTRYTLYRNFYDPYEREWRNGNSRWDIIDMVRMTRALRPEGIEWPNYEDGTPCFKLEMLTAANNLQHEAAHDALSDVYATIAIARLIKNKQPKLYEYAYKLRDKKFASSLIDIDNHKPLLHISSRFPSVQGNAALVLPLSMHPTNKNSVIAYNLLHDPTDLLTLPLEELRLRLFSAAADLPEGVTRLAIKEIHLNKTPMLLSAAMLTEDTAVRLGISRELCERHWQRFVDLTLDEQQQLTSRLYALYGARIFAEKADPEQQLYSGFFEEYDKKLMAKVRRLSPEALANHVFDFKDQRLPELLFRYRARNFPATLSPQELVRWQSVCRERLMDAESFNLAQFQARMGALMATDLSIQQKDLLKKLQIYADNLL